ncbi:MAG: hypothetical protein K0Q50_963 [Vampirovibrio sp.]|jgi:hypothetical protein|nr:hypothetical protein [Vampirovibrio sp.]
MTQPIGPNTNNGYYSSSYNAGGGKPSGIQANQYGEQPLIGPMQGGYNASPYGNPYGSPNDLGSLLNLDPLSYQVYSGYETQPYVMPNMPQPGPGAQYQQNPQYQGTGTGMPPGPGQQPPIPPTYIDDSPLGFSANVIDPMLGSASQTYRETTAMIDEYEKNKAGEKK